MESIYIFLREKQLSPDNIIFYLQNIANEIINGNKNIKYGNGIKLTLMNQNIPMIACVDTKVFIINNMFLSLLNETLENRITFIMLFLHECRHMMQIEKYNNEKDPINQFNLYLYKHDGSQVNKFDNLNHDYYYTEIDAHLFSLNTIDNLKYFNIPDNIINNAKNHYKEQCVENLEYNRNKKIEYIFNGQKKLMTIGQIELYKALIVRNDNINDVSKLFLELTPNNNFQTMNENIKFLSNNYNKYGERLESVILHIEQNKIIEKQEIFNDVINLLQHNINPNNYKLYFYEKLFEIKINQLIQINNVNEKLDNIINYLSSLCFYYSNNNNQNFSYDLNTLLNNLISLKEHKRLIKK